MKRTTSLLWVAQSLALLVALSPCHLVTLSFAAAAPPNAVEIKSILSETRDYWQAPGIAAAVVQDDRIVYLNGVGVRGSAVTVS